MKILIVEDEPEPREGLCQLLGQTTPDWEILPPCTSGEEGLTAVESLRPDLVITDIRMAHLDGLEMVQAFQQAGSHPAIIVLSGYPDFDYARRCLSLGVKEYLLKPSTAPAIVRAVRSVEDSHWVDGELLDYLQETAEIGGPGVLFLFRLPIRPSLAQKKAIRREVCDLTGNPRGSLVAEFSATGEVFVFVRDVSDVPRAASARLLEVLKQRLHGPVIGGGTAVERTSPAGVPARLRKALRQFLMVPTPGFLWVGSDSQSFAPLSYPLQLEKKLVALLAEGAEGPLRAGLEGFHYELFRAGFDPESAVAAAQRMFGSLERRLEDLDPVRSARLRALALSRRLELALDAQEVDSIFAVAREVLAAPSASETQIEHPRILAAVRLIEGRLTNPPSLAECAAELGMSPEYLSRLFKAEMTSGYANYVMVRRMNLAKNLIANSQKSIHQISLDLGFQNSKYFSSAFRKETGVTPSEYRSGFQS